MSVSGLRGAITANFVPQCNKIACRACRLNDDFLPTLLHILLPLSAVQIRGSCRLDPPWNIGQKKVFSKKLPQTCSKQIWKILGTTLAFLEFWESFWFFWKFSKTRPSMEHRASFFGKLTPKHVWTLENDFWHFWNFEHWTFFEFFLELSLSLYLKNWVRKTALKFFKSGKLNSYFYVRESELIILSPENLKWNSVYWLWR